MRMDQIERSEHRLDDAVRVALRHFEGELSESNMTGEDYQNDLHFESTDWIYIIDLAMIKNVLEYSVLSMWNTFNCTLQFHETD